MSEMNVRELFLLGRLYADSLRKLAKEREGSRHGHLVQKLRACSMRIHMEISQMSNQFRQMERDGINIICPHRFDCDGVCVYCETARTGDECDMARPPESIG